MSEREPREDGKTNFYIPVNGQEVYLTAQNSFIYPHKFEPHYDHIFLELEKDEDEVARSGLWLWRLKQKRFDEMVEALRAVGAWESQNSGWASEHDKKMFKDHGLVVPKFKEPKPETLTQRQVNTINFMAYILLHESLDADEFNGEGDLYI